MSPAPPWDGRYRRVLGWVLAATFAVSNIHRVSVRFAFWDVDVPLLMVMAIAGVSAVALLRHQPRPRATDPSHTLPASAALTTAPSTTVPPPGLWSGVVNILTPLDDGSVVRASEPYDVDRRERQQDGLTLSFEDQVRRRHPSNRP